MFVVSQQVGLFRSVRQLATPFILVPDQLQLSTQQYPRLAPPVGVIQIGYMFVSVCATLLGICENRV